MEKELLKIMGDFEFENKTIAIRKMIKTALPFKKVYLTIQLVKLKRLYEEVENERKNIYDCGFKGQTNEK
ncbi:MAG: hypothetical protein E7166_00410 [Firmicutes bacterium]|nr:hypothetical protein [Bacillota bacterium]